MGPLQNLVQAVSQSLDLDVHLVVFATMKPADLRRIVDRCEIFRPAKLLFPHRDQPGAFGSMGNEALRTGKAVSFLCGGQAIPEEIEPAEKQRLIDKLIGQQEDRAAVAAWR